MKTLHDEESIEAWKDSIKTKEVYVLKNGDPAAGALMIVYFAKDGDFWRVLHLGFDVTRRAISKSTASAVPPPGP